MRRCTGLPLPIVLLVLLLSSILSCSCSASTSSSLLKQAIRNGRHHAHVHVPVRSSATAAARRAATKAVTSRSLNTGSLRLLRQGKHAVGSATSAAASTTARTALKRRAFAFRPAASTGGATALASTATATASATASSTLLPSTTSVTGTSTATGTGFRQFSQRATRLQMQLQRSFSLRAIFSDVITNHPGSAKANTAASFTEEHHRHQQHKQWQSSLQDMPAVVQPRLFGARDLHLLASGTLRESWSGFVGGYALATTTDVTRQLYSKLLSSIFRPSTASAAATSTATISQVLPYPSLLRFSQDTLQMHARSLQFGLEWAQMSAVFGASRLLVQQLRRQEDEWNTVLGSALAGSVFACLPKRQLPPVAMARGALLYGGTMFVLHPSLWKDGMHKLMLTPPEQDQEETPTTTRHGKNKPPTQSSSTSSLSATHFRNQPMQWWDGGI